MLGHVLLALFSFAFTCVSYAYLGSSCLSEDYIKYSCKRRVMIVIDSTSNTRWRRETEFNISTSIIQRLDIRKDFISVGLATYGEAGSTIYDFSDSRNGTCRNLANLQKTANAPANIRLSRLILTLFTNYGLNDVSLVLMTNSSEQEDVDAAGGLLRYYINRGMILDFNAVIINFGRSSFGNWPEDTNVFRYNSFDDDYVADYLRNYICGHGVDVDYTSEDPSVTVEYTTVPTSTYGIDFDHTSEDPETTFAEYTTVPISTYGIDFDHTSEDPETTSIEYTTVPTSAYGIDFDHTSEDPETTSAEYTTVPTSTYGIDFDHTSEDTEMTSAEYTTVPSSRYTTLRAFTSSTPSTTTMAPPMSSTSTVSTSTRTTPRSSSSTLSTTSAIPPMSSTTRTPSTTTTTLSHSTLTTPSTTSTTIENTSTAIASTITESRTQTSAPTLSSEPFALTTTVHSMSTLGPTEPSLPVANIMDSGCKCVLKTVWLDVFLLMESGVAMTENGITSATDYIVSAFTKLTVGQAERFQTRLGVIRYASSVELIADLNVYTSTADLFDLNISLLNETGTNIEGAIRMATKKFSSSSHRRAARPVIIIVGSTYKDGGFNDPTQIAREFREDGGTIITIEYVQEHGLAVPMLRTLASPNFSLTNKKMDGTQLRADELRQLLCEANCFCKKNWMPYRTNKWDAPHGGCYYPVPIPSIQILANRTCFRRNDARLVLDEDSKKDAFLMYAFPPKTKFWLGLRYDGNQWTWPGGYSAGFTKWAPGQPNYRTGNCAYVQLYRGLQSAWFTDDCDNDHNYICQAKPCDSTKYCPAE